MRLFFIILFFAASQSLIAQDNQSTSKDIDDVSKILYEFVGKWEGTATAFFP